MMKFYQTLFLILLPFLSLNANEFDEEAVTHHVSQFQNERVKVWKSVIFPNEPVDFHRHEFGAVIVGLNSGTLNRVYENGETEVFTIDQGCSYWLSPEKEFLMHSDVNVGKRPLEVMIVEMRP